MKSLLKLGIAVVIMLVFSVYSTLGKDSEKVIAEAGVACNSLFDLKNNRIAENTSVFEFVHENKVSCEMVKYEGEVLTHTTKISRIAYDDMSKQEAMRWYIDESEYYQKKSGFDYSIEFDSEAVTIMLSIDYTEADLNGVHFQLAKQRQEEILSYVDEKEELLEYGYIEIE